MSAKAPLSATPSPRPGGRSARVQAAVHAATRLLLDRLGHEAVSVPLIAAEAGVTPSTIYRRWGDLAALLADAAVDRLRPDAAPDDTGSLAGDLLAWAQQYQDEMAAPLGRQLLRDVLGAPGGVGGAVACRCAGISAGQLGGIVQRARARGEPAPEVQGLLDGLAAPILYRILFLGQPATAAELAAWVRAASSEAAAKSSAPATSG